MAMKPTTGRNALRGTVNKAYTGARIRVAKARGGNADNDGQKTADKRIGLTDKLLRDNVQKRPSTKR